MKKPIINIKEKNAAYARLLHERFSRKKAFKVESDEPISIKEMTNRQLMMLWRVLNRQKQQGSQVGLTVREELKQRNLRYGQL